MEEFLTKRKLQSKHFVKNKTFKCVIPGGETPADQNWMNATYVSVNIKNGADLGIHSSRSLFQAIKPFTESLFVATYSHWGSLTNDYLIYFEIEIENEEGFIRAGDFDYRSDGDPVEPEMGGVRTNRDLFRYLQQLFKIVVKTHFVSFPNPCPLLTETVRFLRPQSPKPLEETEPPKPLEETIKPDQCVICLERKPDVLFIECNHICVCRDCEKTRSSTRCPYCRTNISKRIII